MLLALCMVLTLLNGVTVSASAVSEWDGTKPAVSASYAFSGGTGTSADPYLIGTAADFAQLAANNIVTGYAGKFNPDNALTREQLAAFSIATPHTKTMM